MPTGSLQPTTRLAVAGDSRRYSTREGPGMVVCPRCGKSSYSTTYCVSCGARLDEIAQIATEPPEENTSPTHSAYMSAIHNEWPVLQLDEDNLPEYRLDP